MCFSFSYWLLLWTLLWLMFFYPIGFCLCWAAGWSSLVMGERIPSGSYFQYPPHGHGVPASPVRSSSIPSDLERLVHHLLISSSLSSIDFSFSVSVFWGCCWIPYTCRIINCTNLGIWFANLCFGCAYAWVCSEDCFFIHCGLLWWFLSLFHLFFLVSQIITGLYERCVLET